MKPATELVGRGEGADERADPLTTPIYETTTFLFESADEVRQYNEGKSPKFLYSRYANPTVRAVERKIAALEGAEAALVLSSGQAATTTALMALLAGSRSFFVTIENVCGSSDLLLSVNVPPERITTVPGEK